MNNEAELSVKICMGSSCFARGNYENLTFIEEFIKKHDLSAKVELVGSRCEGLCARGPNIIVNGRSYTEVSKDKLERILKEVCMAKSLG